ncbi:ABC transporter permease [Paenibacillus sp. MZ04-78.2]|uniref:ABC transporter permease n=1 Tax=Paenibacillus sp. MZ04-78.2 TaxID=2962034 RepID=UPI0020B828BC|nr:ABC transporter permease [Paenibacillus sp. MZ04-78.2]MCP3776486.1 ABC transporter permease [Paenibacillus sp. MZ04-78.2]
MRTLIVCEVEKLVRRKWIWVIFLSAPFLAYTAGSYFLWLNPPDSSSSVSPSLFPMFGLRQNLYFICNIVVAVLVAAVYTEEFRGGQLRFLFLRRYARGQIFFCKLFVIQLCILMLLLAFGISLVAIGIVRLPLELPSLRSALGYTVEYYILAYASLVGISCVFSFIAMYSKNVTYAIGISLAYVLVSLLFDGLYLKLAALFSYFPYLRDLISYVLVPYMQHTGLHTALSGSESALWAIATVLIVNSFVFTWLAYRRFVADDYMN